MSWNLMRILSNFHSGWEWIHPTQLPNPWSTGFSDCKLTLAYSGLSLYSFLSMTPLLENTLVKLCRTHARISYIHSHPEWKFDKMLIKLQLTRYRSIFKMLLWYQGYWGKFCWSMSRRHFYLPHTPPFPFPPSSIPPHALTHTDGETEHGVPNGAR